MHILVTGSNGQLGEELQIIAKTSAHNFVFTDVSTLDISNLEQIKNYLSKQHFDAIINCAAYTAVDKCETETEAANAINNIAVEKLAKACNKHNTSLIHISTDYVFDGTNYLPYNENDVTNPKSVYGKTKLAGEQAIIKNAKNAVIIRTSWLYSTFGNNFLKTIIKHANAKPELNVVFDQIGTPTYAYDLAFIIINNIDTIINIKGINTFHYSNEGVASWYDFAKEIVTLNNINCNIKPIETKDYPLPAPRPHYSILNKYKIKQALNISIPHWKDSLKKCIEKL